MVLGNTLAELQTGSYEIKVERTGFQAATVTGVLVEVAGERRVDVSLTVAGAETTVMIAETAQVQTTTNTLGGTITAKDVAELPVNGRDFTKVLVLVAGATGDPSGATDSPGSFGLFSANGNRTDRVEPIEAIEPIGSLRMRMKGRPKS